MSAPTTWVLAALMLAVSAHHLGRLAFSVVGRRPGEPAVDLTHAAMGVVMALMLLTPVPSGWGRLAAVAFVVPLAWFAWRTVLVRSAAHAWCHTVLAAGMVVMLLVPQPAAAVAGTSATTHVHHHGASSADPLLLSAVGTDSGPSALLLLLAGLLTVALLAVVVWTGAGLLRGLARRPRPPAARPGPPAPLLTAGCQLLMAATTAGMLVVMV